MDASFIDELASAAPTPGGGGASACVGAIAAALASMVGELTVGKKRYAAVEAEVAGSLGRLAILRSRLMALIDEDAEAFSPMARAYAMPASTDAEAAAKEAALQGALAGACEPPLAVMRACIDVLHECGFLARNGSRLAVSDAGACAVLAHAAAVAASFNVYINADAMADASLRERMRSEADSLVRDARELADAAYGHVACEIGAPVDGCVAEAGVAGAEGALCAGASASGADGSVENASAAGGPAGTGARS